jgi:hypothetical protein
MSITESAAMPRRGGRPRSMRPERITLGDIEYIRNDVLAKQLGCCERTLNRGDRERYAAFIASGIRARKPPSSQRKTA